MKYSDYKAATFAEEPEAKREYEEQERDYERIRRNIAEAVEEGKIDFADLHGKPTTLI